MSTTWPTTTVHVEQPPEADPSKLRELASWYRQFAERAGNPMIWEARLLTAKDLDAKADRIERLLEPVRQAVMVSISANPIVNDGKGQARASAVVMKKRGFVVDKITTRSARNRTETADLAAPI
jgi:hypothetical protein